MKTNVYADELPTAESMAKEVMATNLMVSDRGGAANLLLEEEEESREDGSQEGRRENCLLKGDRGRDLLTERVTVAMEPPAHSFREEVPIWERRRFLSPLRSVQASGWLGPEAGRSPSATEVWF